MLDRNSPYIVEKDGSVRPYTYPSRLPEYAETWNAVGNHPPYPRLQCAKCGRVHKRTLMKKSKRIFDADGTPYLICGKCALDGW